MPETALVFFREMLGAPNEWREENGKFVHFSDTEESFQALEEVTKLWAAGYIHPDGFAKASTADLASGAALMAYVGFTSWFGYINANFGDKPDQKITAIPAPKFDGGGLAQHFLGNPLLKFGAIPKAVPKAKVEKLLELANWFACPFGSAEHVFQSYGIEGVTFTWSESGPSYTSQGLTQIAVPRSSLVSPPFVLYTPGHPDDTKAQWEFQKLTVPSGIAPAHLGLYSATDDAKGAALLKQLTAVQNDIIQGRKPLSTWTEAVTTWKRNGGDQIRRDYESAFAQNR